MPYIKQDRRKELNHSLAPATVGELNYCITTLLDDYWQIHKSYQVINDIVGAIESAKLEFYRRVAVPYENGKMAENGDVYD